MPGLANGLIRAPLFVRDGAIIPEMGIDDLTMNILGQRQDGSAHNRLILNVYSANQGGDFTLIEDDGETMAYHNGAVRQTVLTQEAAHNSWSVTINPAQGTYSGASTERSIEIHLITPSTTITSLTLNGVDLPLLETEAAFNTAERGWFITEWGTVITKYGTIDVSAPLQFIFLP